MSNTVKKVLLWLPLPEKVNWRGEGIAQSIENIVSNASNDVEFFIYTAKSVGGEIQESFSERNIACEVHFVNGALKRVKKNELVDASILNNHGLIHRLTEITGNFYISIRKYQNIIMGYLAGKNHDELLSKFDAIWVPSPVVKLVSKENNHKIFYNFWDPFVFEYKFFGFYSKYFFYKRFAFIKKSNYKIITQSEFNKKYLINVFGFDADKVTVVRLGGATAPEILNTKKGLKRVDFNSFPLRYSSEKISTSVVINEMDNRSGLFRSIGRLKEDTKILFVTTQNRPYKGLYRLLEIYSDLLKKHDIFLITTADIQTMLADDFPSLTESVCMLRRVTNKQHQFLMQNSDLVIHPSYVEGGQGAFSMFEAAMMNIPSLVNWGRHIEEFSHFHPNQYQLDSISVDFDKDEPTKKIIEKLLFDKDCIKKNIDIVKSLNHSWRDTATSYVEIFSK